MGLDTMTIFLSYLEAEIWQKRWRWWRPFWNPRWRSFHYVIIIVTDLLDPENVGLDARITLLSCLEAEIWLILWFWWRPFWNPTWRPKNANPILANYLSWFWRF